MWGLTIPAQKYHAKQSIKSNQTDFLMLQEVKVGDVCLDATLATIWLEDHFLHTNHINGGGGLVLGLTPCLAKHIVAIDIDPNNHFIWVTTLIRDILIGFCLIMLLIPPLKGLLFGIGYTINFLLLVGSWGEILTWLSTLMIAVGIHFIIYLI